MNRLLVNMQNKIKIIDGAIDITYRLQKGETIELNGLHKMNVKAKDSMHHNDFNHIIIKLFEERESLQVKVDRMTMASKKF